METRRRGRQTMVFPTQPSIASFASVAGKKEGEGPLASYFDLVENDTKFGQKSWEKAESQMQILALEAALKKKNWQTKDLDVIFAGDLLNQCVSSSFSLRASGIPFYGLYGACSTMAESLSLAAMMVDGGYAEHAAAMTSSHFASAERQYRFPLVYGGQRTPTAQWTVTGAGCVLVQPEGEGPYLQAATTGIIVDYGIKDANNMGAAMAPAAAATLLRYLHDTGQEPKEFDAIYTGDLGHLGSRLFREILTAEGLVMKNHIDCGSILYDAARQNVKSGGSGPGCCAAVLCGRILPRLERGSYRRVLFIATGALMSQTTFLQKESIPAIAHLVELRGPECTARG